jgi:Cu-processing system permease protein
MLDLRTILILAQKEWRDARRNRWFVLYTVAFAGLALAMAWLALSGVGTYGLAGFSRTGASLINLVLLIVPLMGLTLGALSIAGERERGTLLYLLAQPVTSTEVLLGKYIGLAQALGVALLLGFGLSGVLMAWQGGAAQAQTYLGLVGLAFCLALVSLSLGVVVSAACKKGSTAIGVALFVWLLLVFLGDLGVMSTTIVMQIGIRELLALTLLNPLQVFKMAAILLLQSSLEILGPAGLYAVREHGQQLLPMLLGLLLLWALLPFVCSWFVLRRRGAF